MFQKPAFGANTTGFGMQSTFGSPAASAASPFGGFKPAGATSAFGAPPAFGATTSAQPNTGGGLFGGGATTGGLFGAQPATAAPGGFGTNTGFGFGANTTTGGLFNTSATTGGLFQPQQNTTAFGAKPTGFGFGAATPQTNTTGGLFGNTQQAGTSLFGQQNNMSGGGLFANNTVGGFGGAGVAQTGTAHVKYSPLVGTDVVVKGGVSQNINIKHHCITCMKEYEGKSLEELRLEDYTAGRKGGGGAGVFGFTQPPETKPLFNTSTFGAATTSAPSVFGGGALSQPAFGQTNSFSFGGGANTSTNTTGLFGAQKPAFGTTTTAGAGLFGAPASTQPTTFGTNTSTFGFGNNLQNQSSGGLFGAKPAGGAFGAAPASSGFGSFGGGGLFGAKPLQTQAPTFGAPQPGVGSIAGAGAFGTTTSSAGGMFSTFGKPAQPAQPAFGFGNAQNTLGVGSIAGAGAFGTTTSSAGGMFSTFGKPAQPAQPAFGFGSAQNTLGLNTSLGGGGAFGASKPAAAGGFPALGGSLFPQQQNNTFRTGLDSGLGSMFGGGATLGSTLNNNALANLSGASAAGNVHEQILALAARPYGDSPLFKDLPDASTTAEDVLKPTKASAQAAVMAAAYRVTSPSGIRLELRPRGHLHDKKSLFEGLEESDASLEDKLSLKPSRKRLVLRHNDTNNRTHEETTAEVTDAPAADSDNNAAHDADRVKRNIHFNDNNNVESSGGVDRQGSWLSASKLPWTDESEPRLYPNIESELQNEVSERRSSWLTTARLRPPAPAAPDSVESSVRELGVLHATPDPQTADTLDRAPLSVSLMSSLQFGDHSDTVALQISGISVSEEETPRPRSAAPHPAGVRCTRAGYYTIPSLDEMIGYQTEDGRCVVPHLTIGRTNYGNVHYDAEIDVTNLDIDALVHFLNKEVIVYPEDADKPPVGEGLNRRAIVTLDRIWPRDKTERRPITDPDSFYIDSNKEVIVYPEDADKPPVGEGLNRRAIVTLDRIWPRDKTERRPITDPDRLLKLDYEGKLRRVCDKHDTKFIEYRPQTGSWVFRVEHFSKYGLTDSDEEDEPAPEVLKRQLVQQPLQKNAAPPSSIPLVSVGGAGGGAGAGAALGGGAGAGAGLGGLLSSEDSIFAMHQSSINLLGGASKAFEMDTTEENGESHSLYQDNRAFGVKSPTSELARLEMRQSAHVQLMKASLYADAEMEDDISISTGDQLVPLSAPPSLPEPPVPAAPSLHPLLVDHTTESTPMHSTEEVQMKPLMVQPHTIVLKYHRKIPPFKQTIAGRLDASSISDMSVSRARHSRVGFGPRGELVFASTYSAINNLPNNAELSSLSRYVCGRAEDDWSEPLVARLALAQPKPNYNVQEVLGQHLDSLLEYSTFSTVDPEDDSCCSRLQLAEGARERHAALQQIIRTQAAQRGGAAGAYALEVYQLCDALWGADLENGGVPGRSARSAVERHRRLVAWLTAAVADLTDAELAAPAEPDPDDESDSHSCRIWTLMLGGRVLEACRLARQHGDLNLAALLAQAGGDPSFKSLVSRQLSLWCSCGALGRIGSHRQAALQLAAGSAPALLRRADWRQALRAQACYLSPQVPTLEQVVRRYEALFSSSDDDEEEVDLTLLGDDEGMRVPRPDYYDYCDLTINQNGRNSRPLDLRYSLIRARALNTRPRPAPQQHTADPFDYSLCFVLDVWFGNPGARTVSHAAALLEAAGDWPRAVHALLYHPCDKARAHLIQSMISRHAGSLGVGASLELLEKLRLPRRWVPLARAHYHKYMHQPGAEAEQLAAAGQWNAAHTVLIEELLPQAVLADELVRYAPLLQQLSAAAERHEVSGWQRGGQALHHYMHVCEEIRKLVSQSTSEPEGRRRVSERLEALRPRLAAACKALPEVNNKSVSQCAARAEMGARLVQLCVAAGEPPHHLASLLRALRLPPDCTAHAHYKITTELAEQASELCIESATESPVSSHHRASAARAI